VRKGYNQAIGEIEKEVSRVVSQIQDLKVKVKKANVVSDFELGYTSALSKVIELLVSPSTFIHIPFLAEFEGRMLNGKKTVTARTKRYGEKGNCFKAFGAIFIITFVEKMPLGDVRCYWYEREGFESQDKFIKIWKRIHPRKGFVSIQRVWVHGFKLLEGSASTSTDSKETKQ